MSVPIQHHTRTHNGVRLHYATSGAGDPVLLLHGFPQTWKCWRKLVPLLAGTHAVLAPDLRGLGDSQKTSSGYDAATLAEDFAALLSDLKLPPAHVVGHDLGGPPAYVLAARHPKLVRTLTLVEAPLPGVGAPPAVIPATGEVAWHFGFHLAPGVAEMLVAGREHLYLSYFFRHFAYDPGAIPPDDAAEYARSYALPGAFAAAMGHYRAIPETTATIAELAKSRLKIPVLAFGGEACLMGDVLERAKLIARDVHGGTVPMAGHWVAEERPDYLAEQLLAHFARG